MVGVGVRVWVEVVGGVGGAAAVVVGGGVAVAAVVGKLMASSKIGSSHDMHLNLKLISQMISVYIDNSASSMSHKIKSVDPSTL